jgi:hypothetical protein
LSCIGCGDAEALKEDSCPNKDAFNDVAIRSNEYWPATEKAHALLEHSHPVVKAMYLDSTQATVNIIGCMAIPSFVTTIVYTILVNLNIYKDATSETYIADPVMVTGLCWIMSAYIAFGFMTLWDHTADALLYCYAWSRMWKRDTVDKYIPESLRFVVGFDDKENDRYPYYGRAKNNMYLRYWLPGSITGDQKKKEEEPPKMTGTMMGSKFGAYGQTMGAGGPSMSDQQGSFLSGIDRWNRQEQALTHETVPLMRP